MKIKEVKMPENLRNGYSGDNGEITEDQLLQNEHGIFNDVIAAWYWYVYESYEGSGYILMVNKHGNWACLSLSHCSCNDPLFDTNKHELTWWPSAASIMGSDEWHEQTDFLFKQAMEDGYLDEWVPINKGL